MSFTGSNPNGQVTSANSSPVVIASDQSAVPISAASLPLPSDAATQTTLALIKAKTDNIDVALSTRAVTGLTDAEIRATALPVSASSLPLPSGAATSAKQDLLLTELQLKADLSETQPVSVATLPLPSGAGTAANQVSILAAVDTLESIFTDVIGFETVANLTSGSTYSSGLLALSPPYSQVLTNILSDRNGTMNIYWYSDAGGTDLVRTLTIAYTAGDGFLSFGAPAFTKYVKYEFTNSAGASTTDFYFTTKFLTKPVNGQIATLKAPLSFGMVGAVTRSILVGETTAGGGAFVNVKVNPSGTLETNATLAAGTALVGKVSIDQVTANANEVVTKTGSVTAITKTALTANAATSVSCAAATTVLIASNASRKGLVITNTGLKDIYIGIGAAAVLNQGIYLAANGGVWIMDEYTFSTQDINGITTGSTSNIALQEFQ